MRYEAYSVSGKLRPMYNFTYQSKTMTQLLRIDYDKKLSCR